MAELWEPIMIRSNLPKNGNVAKKIKDEEDSRMGIIYDYNSFRFLSKNIRKWKIFDCECCASD